MSSSFFPKQLNYGGWRGFHQGNGVYSFLFVKDNPEYKIIDPSSGTVTPILNIGKKHKLVRISVYKSNATEVTFSIDYVPDQGDRDFPEKLYNDATFTGQSIIFEADERSYISNGAEYIFNLDSGTSANYRPMVVIEFMENP